MRARSRAGVRKGPKRRWKAALMSMLMLAGRCIKHIGILAVAAVVFSVVAGLVNWFIAEAWRDAHPEAIEVPARPEVGKVLMADSVAIPESTIGPEALLHLTP